MENKINENSKKCDKNKKDNKQKLIKKFDENRKKEKDIWIEKEDSETD